jgi:hypothetical protein
MKKSIQLFFLIFGLSVTSSFAQGFGFELGGGITLPMTGTVSEKFNLGWATNVSLYKSFNSNLEAGVQFNAMVFSRKENDPLGYEYLESASFTNGSVYVDYFFDPIIDRVYLGAGLAYGIHKNDYLGTSQMISPRLRFKFHVNSSFGLYYTVPVFIPIGELDEKQVLANGLIGVFYKF